MGRPPRYDAETLLDAAVALAAEGGPPVVTMAAVAAATGAPSGSVYYRFPSRSSLLAAVWLRTLARFHAGFLEAAADASLDAAVAAALHTVTWSRAHRAEALVLLHGAREFGRDDWSEADRDRMAALQSRVGQTFDALSQTLGVDHERLVFALVDIPLALVRRHLTTATPLPQTAEPLIDSAVRAVLLG
jgi:AcrR family transcriptional regulator